MQSKISYFKGCGNRILNWSVWRKDIVSFWPLWAVELFLLQVITTLPLINQMNIVMQEQDTRLGSLEIRRLFHVAVSTGSYVILIAALSILAAVLVFAYLNHSRSAYMLHSLPISRGTFFMTHFFSGLFMLFSPFVVTYGILWGIGIRYHLGMGAVVIGNLITTFLVILFFYSLACVVVMLSGNGIMSMVVYGVLNVLEVGFFALLGLVSEQFLYAADTFEPVTGTLDEVCTPILGFMELFKNKESAIRIFSRGLPGVMGDGGYGFLSEYFEEGEWEELMQGLVAVDWKSIGFCLLSLVVSALFLLLAFKLHQRRPLERVGDLVAFNWCRAVFKAVFCACGSLLCVCLFSVLFSGRMANITYGNQRFACVAFMLFGCIISYLTGDMILAKSFFIWKKLSWVQMGFFCGAMLVVLGANYFVSVNRQLSTETAEKADYLSLRVGNVSFLYPKEEYERLGLEKIRQDIIREGQELAPADIGRSAYTVSDDMSLAVDYKYIIDTDTEKYAETSRFYYVNEEKQGELVKNLKDAINNTDNMAAAVFTGAYESAECKVMEMRKSPEDEFLYYIKNDDARERVFQAFLKDLQEGKFPMENWGRYSRFEEDGIELCFQVEIAEGRLEGTGLPEELWWEYESNDFVVAVTEEMENTWKAVQGLKKTDLGDDLGEEEL